MRHPPAGLKLYVSDDILTAPFRRHPFGVIETDIAHARYGGGLDLREIITLTLTAYAERAAQTAILPRDRFFNQTGGHHLSSVVFANATVYAVDGQGWEAFHHELTGRIAMGRDRLRRTMLA